MSCVYVAPLCSKTAFKVGKADDAINRLRELHRYYDFDFGNSTIIQCGLPEHAFQLESILHATCEGQRVLFDYPGGTEFFKFEIYEDALIVVNVIAKLKGYSIEKIPEPIAINQPEPNEVSDTMVSLGLQLKNKRLHYNITQRQLANVCKVSLRLIQNMEKGSNVTLANFISVTKALDLDSMFTELDVPVPLRERSR
jgi:hypothetical protein